jgi:hypothetical protein
MIPALFATAIFVLLIFSTMLAARPIHDASKNIWQGWTSDGKAFLFVNLLLGIMSFGQVWYNDWDADNRDQQNLENYTKELLKVKRSFDTSMTAARDTFKSDNRKIVLGLAEYGFKLDTANARIINVVRDSQKTKVYEAANPVLFLPSDPIVFYKTEKGKNFYGVRFQSREAASTGFEIIIEAIPIKNWFTAGRLSNIFYFEKNDPLVTSIERTLQIEVPTTPEYDHICFWVHGIYYNTDITKKFTINKYLVYDVSTNSITYNLPDALNVEVIEKFVNKFRFGGEPHKY